tara:strand:+ start:339 stop:557 length:219 start_codon:yes stop_codon:yes gene_type:complete
MALEASAVGNVIVKSPEVEVLSAPKSKTMQASFVGADASERYIIAPRAVIVAFVNVSVLKLKNAVVPLVVGT